MLRLIRPTRRAAALAGAAALGVSGALVLGIGLHSGAHAVPVPVAPAPSTAVAVPTTAAPASGPTPATPPSETPTPTALHTPSSSVHLTIGAVGLDLPVLPLTPRRGVIDPPTLTAAYWIEPYGAPVGSADRADNTLYIAAHSAGRGDDGFGPLLTPDHRGGAVAAGDVVEVRTPGGTVTYTVQRTARYARGELAGASEIWEAVPGRLVLITCFQRADGGQPTENFVVVAES
ncbi:MAG TPA: class F sortase [Geodermatophilus sp.]|nr:class F sortase [Geodermatophilus sp.]